MSSPVAGRDELRRNTAWFTGCRKPELIFFKHDTITKIASTVVVKERPKLIGVGVLR